MNIIDKIELVTLSIVIVIILFTIFILSIGVKEIVQWLAL